MTAFLSQLLSVLFFGLFLFVSLASAVSIFTRLKPYERELRNMDWVEEPEEKRKKKDENRAHTNRVIRRKKP